jgi:hypothetical protein
MTMRRNTTMCACALLFAASGAMVSCGDSVKESPQWIEADGQTYVACRDSVYLSNEGGGGGLFGGGGETTFRVKFTDAAGLSHVIKGIKKLHVSELPKATPACKSQ